MFFSIPGIRSVPKYMYFNWGITKLMIYTVTFNPALDYTLELDNLSVAGVNRAKAAELTPGGKGINVSIVLKSLGLKNRVLGFIAGFTGTEIERSLQKSGHSTDFIHLKSGMTRINVKLVDRETTDINAPGPEITGADLKEFQEKLKTLKKGDILVLSGAVPPCLPDFTYAVIMEKLEKSGVKIVVDAAGQLLLRTLPCRPFLIKPNIDELEQLFSIHIETKAELIKYALELKEMGAENVLVSLGPAGAILAGSDGCIYECAAPAGEARSTVGAGDSMVAGFLYGYKHAETANRLTDGLKYGVCAGSASVFSNGLASKEDILLLSNKVSVSCSRTQ